MQLTGRSLIMALAACVASGAAFGVVTSLARAQQPSTPETVSAPSTPLVAPTIGPTELGDEIASYPLTTTSATVSPSSASEASSTSLPTSKAVTPTATPSAVLTSAPAHVVAGPTQRPARQPSAAARWSRPPDPKPAASRPPAGDPGVPLAAATTSRPKPKVTRPVNGWHPPVLRVGDNDISAPVLSSGADVGMVIGCSPSSACILVGEALTITAHAAAVNVSWSATRTHGYPGWQATVDWSAS